MLHELLSRNFDLSRKDAVLQWYLDAAQSGRRFDWDTRPLLEEETVSSEPFGASQDTATGIFTAASAALGVLGKRAARRWGAFDGVDNDAETVALMRAALHNVHGGIAIDGGIADAKNVSVKAAKAAKAAPSSILASANHRGSKNLRIAADASSARIHAAL